MTSQSWSEARVETLKRLWADGLSASQVALALGGITRNAVIGKVHRLGLSGRTPGGRATRAVPAPRRMASRPARRVPAPTAARAAPPPPPPPAPQGPGLVADLAHLHRHACKWPIGDPLGSDFSFCGRDREGEGPYCAGHRQVARSSARPGPMLRDPWVRQVLAGQRL